MSEFKHGLETPKRYVVFIIGDCPHGGIEDIETSFDTIDEARDFCKSTLERCEVVDRDTWMIVLSRYELIL